MSGARHIRTLWITRKSIDDGYHPPELIEAWDDFCIDENPEGWHLACEEALERVGSDLDQKRCLTLSISSARLDEEFFPSEVIPAFVVEDAAVPRAREGAPDEAPDSAAGGGTDE